MTDPSAIRKLIEGVTEGPWHASEWAVDHRGNVGYYVDFGDEQCAVVHEGRTIERNKAGFEGAQEKRDMEFIAAARTLVPEMPGLIEALNKAQAVLAMLTGPEAIEQTNAMQAWAQAVEAEATARSALARIAELEAGMGERK